MANISIASCLYKPTRIKWAQNTVGHKYLNLITSSAILHPIMKLEIEAHRPLNQPQCSRTFIQALFSQFSAIYQPILTVDPNALPII